MTETGAEYLRAAADHLRAVAGKAPPGAWFAAVQRGKTPIVGKPTTTTRSRTTERGLAIAICGAPGEAGRASARYIATVHPGVALAVADWLDAEAHEAHDGALSVAAAVLGRSWTP